VVSFGVGKYGLILYASGIFFRKKLRKRGCTKLDTNSEQHIRSKMYRVNNFKMLG
jgi:hypothetical protein